MCPTQTASGHLSTQADLLGASSHCLEHGRGDCMLTYRKTYRKTHLKTYRKTYRKTYETYENTYHGDYMLTYEKIYMKSCQMVGKHP